MKFKNNFPDNIVEKMTKGRALKRISEPEEIPPAFLFPASDEASDITGQVIGVDGGLVI